MNVHKKGTFVILSIILAASSTYASSIPDDVFDLYESAATGDKAATREAFEALSKLREKEPASVLINTALGSTETMVARDSWMPWKKLKYAELGLNRMDKAIRAIEREAVDESSFAGVPAELWVKTTVGCTFIEMPQMFDRLESGYQILSETIASKEAKEAKEQDVAKLAPLFLCAGMAANQLGYSEAAKKYLSELVTSAPDTKEATAAKTILGKL